MCLPSEDRRSSSCTSVQKAFPGSVRLHRVTSRHHAWYPRLFWILCVCRFAVKELLEKREVYKHRVDKLETKMHNMTTAVITESFLPGRPDCLKGNTAPSSQITLPDSSYSQQQAEPGYSLAWKRNRRIPERSDRHLSKQSTRKQKLQNAGRARAQQPTYVIAQAQPRHARDSSTSWFETYIRTTTGFLRVRRPIHSAIILGDPRGRSWCERETWASGNDGGRGRGRGDKEKGRR